MSSSRDHRRPSIGPLHKPTERGASERERERALELLSESGLDLDPAFAQQLQSQIGNQGVQERLGLAEEPIEQEREAAEEAPESDRLSLPKAPSVSGIASTGLPPIPSGLSWGGGDEAPPGVEPVSLTRRWKILDAPGEQRPGRQAPPAQTPTPRPRRADPRGDEALEALWRTLNAPGACAGALDLTALAHASDHPLGRCRWIGRLLERRALAPDARALASLAGPLPGPVGLASAVARAASIVTLAAALDAGSRSPAAVDRAVGAALHRGAFEEAREISSTSGRPMRAQLLLDGAPLRAWLPAAPPAPGGRPMVRAALVIAADLRALPPPPSYPAPAAPDAVLTSDPVIAAAIAALRGATGDRGARVEVEGLSEMIEGLIRIMEGAGRIQVELAAAGRTSIALGAPPPEVFDALAALDHSLRAQVQVGLQIDGALRTLLGRPMAEARGPLRDGASQMVDLCRQIDALRGRALDALSALLAGEDAAAPPAGPLSDACDALRAGDRAAARSLLASIEGDGPDALAALTLRSGMACADGDRSGQALARAAALLASARRCWPAWSSAALDAASWGGAGERTALEIAERALQREGDPGVLLRARMLELDARA